MGVEATAGASAGAISRLAAGDATVKGVLAHGAAAGLVYSALNPRFEVGDVGGKAKEIPVNIGLFAGGDVVIYGAGQAVRAAGRAGARVLEPPGRLAARHAGVPRPDREGPPGRAHHRKGCRGGRGSPF